MSMSIAEAAQFRDLQSQVDALTALVRTLAAEIDVLKAEKPEVRRGRPPKVDHGSLCPPRDHGH